jgi:hypothetical protein
MRKFYLIVSFCSIVFVCAAQNSSDSLSKLQTNKTGRDPVAWLALVISVVGLLVQMNEYRLNRRAKLWRLSVTCYPTFTSEREVVVLTARAVNVGERDVAIKRFGLQIMHPKLKKLITIYKESWIINPPSFPTVILPGRVLEITINFDEVFIYLERLPDRKNTNEIRAVFDSEHNQEYLSNELEVDLETKNVMPL